jgi:hypothetical protein
LFAQKALWRFAKARRLACSRRNSLMVDATVATNMVLTNPASAIIVTYIGISLLIKEPYSQ